MPQLMPHHGEIEFKKGFIERYSKLTDWKKFKQYCCSYLRRSIRVNTLKISVGVLKKRLEGKGFTLVQVPWCKEGFDPKPSRLETPEESCSVH